MLLVIDVGNTNTVLGVYEGKKLLAHWRLTTEHSQTVDEYGILARNLLALAGLDASKIDGVIIASVVPPLNATLKEMAERYFRTAPLFVEPGIKTGIRIRYDNPQEVGADRIVNAVAAYEKYGGPCIVVDFGTAITFDAISRQGDYLGGIIAPGIGVSAEALFTRTARLPRVSLQPPPKLIGTNTIASIQSGLYHGFLALVDGVLAQMKAELGKDTKAIATGGEAQLVASNARQLDLVDEFLTLDGLRILYARNLPRSKTVVDQPAGESRHKPGQRPASARMRRTDRPRS